MGKTILITGATGTIGRGLVSRILDQSDAELLLLLHRTGVARDPSDTVHRVLALEPRDMRRVGAVVGDVTQPQLGLSRADYSALTHTVTHVLHAAANTRFDLRLAEARCINVDGTRQVATLARQCPKLEQFGMVSSAYVSGKRTGTGVRKRAGACRGFRQQL